MHIVSVALRRPRVNERLIRAVMRLYDGSKTQIKVGNWMSDGFSVDIGAFCLQLLCMLYVEM